MHPVKVLVVEHEPELRANICLGLRLDGYLVAEAPNGKNALDVLRAELPAVIVLDMSIPAIGSVALLAELQMMHALPHTRVIVVTENGSLPLAIEALSLGAADFLEKPVALGDVKATIEKQTRRSLRNNGDMDRRRVYSPEANVLRDLCKT